jgi:hypothetical protein
VLDSPLRCVCSVFATRLLRVVKKLKTTKKGAAQEPQENGAAGPREHSNAGGSSVPGNIKTDKKYLRMVLWAGLSAVFLGFGSIACGFLAQEENAFKAIALFLGGLAGAGGCIFFFYLFLREISPNPRDPFISTLR